MRVALDTETCVIQKGIKAPPLACVSYAYRDGYGALQSGVLDLHEGPYAVEQWLRDPRVRISGQNFAYDAVVLSAAAPQLLPLFFEAYEAGRITDTMIDEQLIDLAEGKLGYRGRGYYGLEALAKRYADMVLEKNEWRLDYGKLIPIPFSQWPRGAVEYSRLDAVATLLVAEAQPGVVDSVPQACEAFALQLVSAWGMRTDAEAVEALEQRLRRARRDAGDQLIAAGLLRPDGVQDTRAVKRLVEANWPAEFGQLPPTPKFENWEEDFDALPLEGVSTTSDVIMRCKHPTLNMLVDFKKTSKVLSTYLPALRQGVDVPVCTSFNVLQANGRTSSFKPNLQNPPRSGGVRECFVPRPGNKFISVDFDTLEIRTLAQVLEYITNGRTLVEQYQRDPDFDPHTRLAAQIMGVSYEEGMRLKKSDPAFQQRRQEAKCFHPATEVLTRDGWKRIADLLPGEEVMAAWPQDGCSARLEWQVPQALWRRAYEGPLVHIDDYGMDLRVTPEHRMLGFAENGRAHVVAPRDMTSMRRWLNAGHLPDSDHAPNAWPNDMLLRLAVATQADGNYANNVAVRLGFTKKRKIERMRWILSHFKSEEWRETVEGADITFFRLKGKLSYRVKKLLDVDKTLPWRWLKLPHHQRLLVTEEAAFWDAHVPAEERRYEYSTVIKKNADVLQAVAATVGRKTRLTTHTHSENPTWFDTYRLRVSDHAHTRGDNALITDEPYSGDVFCLTVPSSFVLVRDGGIPVITGQCASFGFPGGMGIPRFREYAFKMSSGKVDLDAAKAEKLRDDWARSIPEMTPYFNWCGKQTENDTRATIEQFHSGRVRGGCFYTDLANGMWSALANDGAKAGLFQIVKRCYVVPSSALYGCRVVLFMHDEYLLEAPDDRCHEAGYEMADIAVNVMQTYTPDVPHRAAPAMMDRWRKGAATYHDHNGRLACEPQKTK